MKSLFFIATFLFYGISKTQLSKHFSKELDDLIKAKTNKIKGKQLSSQGSAKIYESNLKLSGFALSFSETVLGNILCGSYLVNGNEEIMDLIFEKLTQLSYQIFDSKTMPELINKGILESDLIRKIKLKDQNNGEYILEITLDKSGTIFIQFLNK